ncbi:hypothetical protein EDD16DRAFT_2305 [Pisolithus croceorrhizus]|nr:hypothetical protein EDD16DRAFT_2305 [Pisolithus croceorrhizus]
MSHAGSPYELSSKPESEESLVSQDRESTACPQELSETQLRRLYDDEEAERLMHLISAYVTEVRLPDTSKSHDRNAQLASAEYTDHDSSSKPAPAPLPPLPRDRSITEYIAHDLILPYLPLDGSTPPPFTIKRFRLTTQRLYLAIIPTYQPLLLDLTSLALWKDKQRSLLYCACFWILWYHDGLLAAFLCRIIWCLLRRRFLPYPSLAEYQEKRQNATRARRFGDEVQRRLSVSTLGPVEIWKLFRAYRAATHDKTKHLLKDNKFQDKPDQTNGGSASAPEADGENTVLEGAEDSEEIQNLKRDLLHLLDIVADLHERVNNILMWRRPAVTRRYCILLSVVAFCVITLPSQYIAKITYMFLGIVYWHLVPVIAALSPANRARIPALLSDAPTDVEYAVELIGQRVASGQELLPRNKDRDRLANPDNSKPDLTLVESSNSDRTEEIGGVNWKKWGARIAQGKSLLEENKSISSLGGVSFPIRSSTRKDASLLQALFEKLSHQRRGASQTEQVHTFPAQHSSAPGLISLTSTTMCFTSLTSKHAKLVVPFSQLRGVKKTGLTKGLAITWVATDQDAQGAVKEEKFHWVGDRDELFARLLACDGGRWIRL